MPRCPSRSVQLRMSLLTLLGVLLVVAGLLVRPNREEVLRAAQQAFHGGDFERAAELYSQAIQSCADTDHAKFNRAAALYELERDGEAAEDFGAVRQNGSGIRAARASYNRGNCLLRQACAASATERQTLLREAIHEYETCLRQTDGRSPSLEGDARHNLALAKKLLEQNPSEHTKTEEPYRSGETTRQLASADRKDTPEESSNHQDSIANQARSESIPARENNETQVCPVCGAECKKCDKQCSTCKSCLGKQGNSASPSGSGMQPSPGEGNGAGKPGGQQPQPSGQQGNQGRTGRSSGSDGSKPASQSSNQPGGVPGQSDGRPRPGSQATRNESSEIGAMASQNSRRSSPVSGPGTVADHDASGQPAGMPQTGGAGLDVSSGAAGIGQIIAEATARELVEAFFQPDPQASLERRPREGHPGQNLPQNRLANPSSPVANQAEKVLRSAVQRIEQSRKQRLKLNDVWRDRPDESRDYKDW